MEFEEFYFVTVYTPNSQSELRRLDYRMEWERDFLAYLLKLQEKKPVICCGDMNVAHQEIDLKNPKTNRKNAGFTDEERGMFYHVCWKADLLILSAISIQIKKESIPGGLIDLRHVKRMQDGESIILLYLRR